MIAVAGSGRAAMILASARTQVAEYLSTLIYVYTLLIVLYIVIQLLFSLGLRPPYSRASDVVLGFLRDVCEPFLRIFRRLLPSFGGIDFSPILAILTLEIVNTVIVQRLLPAELSDGPTADRAPSALRRLGARRAGGCSP